MDDLYEFLVVPFKLCNAPSMFTSLMTSNFHEKLNKFMIIYIDDILVYSKTIKEHVEHLEFVLCKLQQNKLFAIRAKNEFAQEEMDFLKHILPREGVRPHPKKLQAIRDWKRLITVKRTYYTKMHLSSLWISLDFEGIWTFLPW
jgi:hypothetical protein